MMIIRKVDNTVIELPDDTRFISDGGMVYFGKKNSDFTFFHNVYIVIPERQISLIINEEYMNHYHNSNGVGRLSFKSKEEQEKI